jgi:monofunctional glycosyltransferase
MKTWLSYLGRLCLWLFIALLVLQLYFFSRIVLMRWVMPESTAFERSEIYRVASLDKSFSWKQQAVDYNRMPETIKLAVIASEDGDFVNHNGIEWEALERAWQRNAKAEQQAVRRSAKTGKPIAPKVVGGSTITQQLAKNLFLSGERTLLRKAQEFALSLMLEAALPKERILEIYLNSVELGEGIFGVEAASQHYFKKPAQRLSAHEAARLAVMLPRPKFYEKNFNSNYLITRAQTIVARMPDAELP